MTNHEKALRYKEKSKLIGKDIMKLELLSCDRVELVEVLDKESTGRLEIPSFITNIGYTSNVFECNIHYVLNGCKYTDVYVDNSKGVRYSLRGLCSGMESDRIRLECRHWEDIVDIGSLFNNCRNLKNIELVNIDTRNVYDMSSMFNNCESLSSIDISKFNTQMVKDMNGMFAYCKGLKSVVLKGIDTRNLECINGMFVGCKSIKMLELSGINVGKLRDTSMLFSGCSNLEYLDISNWDTDKFGNGILTFSGCNKLRLIKLKGIKNIANVGRIITGIINGNTDGRGICYKIEISKNIDKSKLLGLIGIRDNVEIVYE